jgi:hypothetical protein
MLKKKFSFPVKDNDFTSAQGWCGNRAKCVTVARKPKGVAIRDSKDSSKKTLFFTNEEFTAFIGGVKAGKFGA